MVISSKQNDYIKEIKKLSITKYRKETSRYLVEGEHLVESALSAGVLEEIILLEKTSFIMDIKTTVVSEPVMRTLSELNTIPNVIGVCRMIKPKPVSGNVIMLDNIQDPGNLGAIIRSAVAFNIDTIVASPGTVDLYNSKVLRSTQGMHLYLNFMTADLNTMVNYLKNNKYTIYGTTSHQGHDLKTISKHSLYALILGNEGAGINPELLKQTDINIDIKTNSHCESLNVSVAAGIILYELSKEAL